MNNNYKQDGCFTASWAEAMGRFERQSEESGRHCTWDRCHGFSNCESKATSCSCGCGTQASSSCNCGCGDETAACCNECECRCCTVFL